MELTFEKVGNQYVAEFQAPSDFNLHIEREEIGVLEVHQRGSEEGKYDFAWSTGVNGRKVVDYDFGALVYPKWIKVVSGSEVVSASVNFNEGGGLGSGSGSGDNGEVIYYKFKEPYYIGYSDFDYFQKNTNVFSAARGYYDKQMGYYYGSVTAISGIVGAKYSTYPYIDALEFRPTQYLKSWSDMSIVTYKDYETLVAAFPDIFIPLDAITRITAEEYWQYLKS